MTVLERLMIELNIQSDDTEDIALLENSNWQAEQLIKNRRNANVVETKYEYLQYQIALRLWNTRGIEGQTSYSNGAITRSYNNDGVVADLLRRIPPLVVTGGLPNA